MILGRKERERCHEHAVKAFKYNKLVEYCDGDPEDFIKSLQKRQSAYKANCTRLKNSLELLKDDLSKKDEELNTLKTKIKEYETEDVKQVKELKKTKNKLKKTQTIDFDKFKQETGLQYKEIAKLIGVSTSMLTVYRNNPDKMTPSRHKQIIGTFIKYKKEHGITLKG